jgi:addiction module HigA family antidote
MKIVAKLPPMHPGEMLREEFLKPMGLTPYKVAKACGVPRTRIERIVREELGITADTALRSAKFFGTSVGFWMNLQPDTTSRWRRRHCRRSEVDRNVQQQGGLTPFIM